MLQVFHAFCPDDYPGLLDQYRQYFTPEIIQKSESFRLSKDACRYLLGKVLLIKALQLRETCSYGLDDILFNEFGKPFLPGDLHFNISHSGDHVVCGLNSYTEIGVDVEKVDDIDLNDFSNCFTDAEWEVIGNSDDPRMMFFRFWVRKEAVIKAKGTGLNISLLSFNVIDDLVKIDNETWHLYDLDWFNGYNTCIAAGKAVAADQIIRTEVQLYPDQGNSYHAKR